MVCEKDRQAELRERARRIIAEARRGSTPTTEIIRASSPEIVMSDAEERINRMSVELARLDYRSNIGNDLHFEQELFTLGLFIADVERNGNIPAPKSPTFIVEENGKSSPSSYKHKLSPEKLPEDLCLTEVCTCSEPVPTAYITAISIHFILHKLRKA